MHHELVDRWMGIAYSVDLPGDAFAYGLWRFRLDLSRRCALAQADGDLLGATGRPSWSRRARTGVNRAPAAAAASAVLERALRAASAYDEGARQSMVFDLQRLVAPSTWHTVDFVVGKGPRTEPRQLTDGRRGGADRGRERPA